METKTKIYIFIRDKLIKNIKVFEKLKISKEHFEICVLLTFKIFENKKSFAFQKPKYSFLKRQSLSEL